MNDDLSVGRYSRQVRFAPIGTDGQRRILSSRVAVVGCGALGSVIASELARAGVGFLRVIDRDLVETSNLQRQVLYDESDALGQLPKADAAADRLRQANSTIEIEGSVTDLNPQNVRELLGDVDLVMDGCDNFETRFLINDFCHHNLKPWIYGGAVGSTGQSMTIIPGETPCLRCLVESIPPPGTMPTCETAGIISPASAIIASIQVAEALKILSGHQDAIARGLFVMDLWAGRIRRVSLDGLREKSDCPTCKHGEFPWLEGRLGSHSTSLCGRNAVQVMPPTDFVIDWEGLREELSRKFRVDATPFLFRFNADGYELSVFRDGRAIVRGTEDVGVAKSVYARYLGA